MSDFTQPTEKTKEEVPSEAEEEAAAEAEAEAAVADIWEEDDDEDDSRVRKPRPPRIRTQSFQAEENKPWMSAMGKSHGIPETQVQSRSKSVYTPEPTQPPLEEENWTFRVLGERDWGGPDRCGSGNGCCRTLFCLCTKWIQVRVRIIFVALQCVFGIPASLRPRTWELAWFAKESLGLQLDARCCRQVKPMRSQHTGDQGQEHSCRHTHYKT